jgi:K+-sensing histidine kinase KdpD
MIKPKEWLQRALIMTIMTLIMTVIEKFMGLENFSIIFIATIFSNILYEKINEE